MRPEQLINIESRVIRPVFFICLDLAETPVRMSSFTHEITTADGYVWSPAGQLGRINFSGEVVGTEVSRANVKLDGLPSELYPELSVYRYRGAHCQVLIGLVKEDGALSHQPIRIFSGNISNTQISITPVLSIALTVMGRMATARKSAPSRYTNAEQRANYEGDKGLEFISQMGDLELQWGG